MITRLLEVFFIFLPAFIGNALPVVAKNIPGIRRFSRPISPTWLGKNKTYRGLIAGVLGGILCGIILTALVHSGFLLHWVRFDSFYRDFWNGIFFGFLLSFGALIGDMIKSFAKRRVGKKPGAMFQPWDGIDYILASIIVMLPFIFLSWIEIFFLLLIGPLLSLTCNIVAYSIGWKDCWY